MSGRRLLGAHPAGVVSGASGDGWRGSARECLGCQTQFAVDVRLLLPARRCPDCGADVLARAVQSRVRTRRAGRRSTRCGSGGRNHDAAFHRGSHPAGADRVGRM